MKKIVRNIILTEILIALIAIISICIVETIPPDASEVFNKSLKSIVEVKAYSEVVGESFGSAEFIDSDGTLITNAHVVTYTRRGETNVFDSYEVRFATDEEYIAVKLIKYDIEKDLAVLKLENESVAFDVIEHGDSDKLNFGDKVYAIGNASNYGLSITQGVIGMPKVNIEYDGMVRQVIQCDLTISAGNSGGALLDERGRLIGITTFRTKDNAGNVIFGLAYCIPINNVKAFLSEE